ncbi:single-stranded-DNA-specific exonuclease RecJ [Aestuariirhabdus litorea]|uniref:Single-stranded-DNA-specific exonuclease RecJ n=1 Tax=Aestuariirhabdus litorea TaxID=2528527 RepID=A0A3P3VS04_9GAMM|nr:single-stranded-DNA-specific exonuclease RecJ [Aestuariirhabdus litorea]RRJ85224.1 single-stranded-DNA-specific exonuclease RecJ [Aestuariirhabdus litorea]RWW98445.1 single-stranded-DNA-specific exonuclease RecJ [Endozoicomonadaceae bacterium GTF-13]
MAVQIQRRQPQVEAELPGVSPLLQRLYAARGVSSPEQLQRSLQQLQGFEQLKGIAAAARVLADTLEAGESILVVGDFDADGATSSALAVLALRALGAQSVDYLVPNRFEYGYGLSPEIVVEAARRDPSLIVTVDNGISSIEGVAEANRRGMRVVVTDHHLAGEQLPQAAAIVNPNQPGCDSITKNSAGVGVVFYVLCALRAELAKRGWFHPGRPQPNLAEYLDIVALGTVADVVALDHNNRILVHQGVQRIRAGACRPGIRALLEVARRELPSLSASDLGFVVAPRLNAAGRLDDMSLGIECLLCDDPQQAHQLAVQLDTLNRERRDIEAGMQEQALQILASTPLDAGGSLPHALCLYDPGWHQGVIGILASRIKERVHRPVVAFADGGEGCLKGSARSIPGFHIRDALERVASSHPGMITRFGGHAMAAGLTLPMTHYEAFSQALQTVANAWLGVEQLEARLLSDGELSPQEFSLEVAAELRDGGPWGQGFAEPRFDGEFEVISQRLVADKHLKLVLALPDSGVCVDAIAFNVDLERWPNTQASQVRLLYKLDINRFRGRQSLQLLVDHLEALPTA